MQNFRPKPKRLPTLHKGSGFCIVGGGRRSWLDSATKP